MGKFFFFSRKFYTSETGIVVKASDNVQPDSLAAAADQINHMLGKTENGIAARMAEYGASMALYGPDENAYFIPEHRSAWDPDLYEQPQSSWHVWPNTYAISNADEFFATMCTIWFSVMEESPDWTDGVRGPVNTREDLLKYDPETYAFFDKIFWTIRGILPLFRIIMMMYLFPLKPETIPTTMKPTPLKFSTMVKTAQNTIWSSIPE